MFIVINIGNKLLRKLLKIAFKKLHNEMISTFWEGEKLLQFMCKAQLFKKINSYVRITLQRYNKKVYVYSLSFSEFGILHPITLKEKELDF